MKTTRFSVLGLAVVLMATPDEARAAPVGTAFTFQGQLIKLDQPVDGTCDFTFTLWDAASGPAQVGPTLTFSGHVQVLPRPLEGLPRRGEGFVQE